MLLFTLVAVHFVIHKCSTTTTSTAEASSSNEEAATLIDPSFFGDDSLNDDPVINDLADGLNNEPLFGGDDSSRDDAFADFDDILLEEALLDQLVG